jgi:asparagine synthase (glutamine-hydrolysing)
MDIANMANSLEGRSPFLCKELLEYVPGMKDEFKVKGSTTKYLLRQLSKKYLPPEIINQPKRGFEIPLKNWVNNELKEVVFDYVASPNSISRQFIKNDFLDALLSNKVKISAEKRAKILWTLLSMEIWYKKLFTINEATRAKKKKILHTTTRLVLGGGVEKILLYITILQMNLNFI